LATSLVTSTLPVTGVTSDSGSLVAFDKHEQSVGQAERADIGVTDLVIGVVSLVFGASGWITYFFQRRSTRNDELVNALTSLYRAIGAWIDGVTEASEFAGCKS
jgi:hypothetical protein